MAARVSDHPNVVTIYDVGEHGSVPFIVMELYTAGSVADRLRGPSRVPQAQALTWLEHAAAALDYAHGEGIVHRDVKPANLLLDERGRLAVADFGIARLADDSNLTQAGQVLGTAAYLSPEQALGHPATTASDRYALGIVAFELLVGRRPFGGDNIAAQARQHVDSPPPETGLGPEVDHVLHRVMAKDPHDRYPTAARLVEELRAAVSRTAVATPEIEATRPMERYTPTPTPTPAPVAAPPPPPPARAVAAHRGDGSGRRGWMALAGLAALALIVGLVAVFASGGDDDPAADRASGSSAQRDQQRTTEERSQEEQPEGQAAEPAPAPAPSAEETPAEPEATPDNEGEGEGAAGPSAAAENPRSANDAGYAKLQAGDAAGAVPLLQSSVKGYEEQGDRADAQQYGFALYNLAEALRQSGKPGDAIPYYERRLQVNPSDRPGIVRASLAKAKAAAGQ
jgi:serine/threonine-protein kinase